MVRVGVRFRARLGLWLGLSLGLIMFSVLEPFL